MPALPGVDPTASVGVSGDATGVQQVESAIELKESKTVEQQEIAHTNMGLGLNVLERQFIYNSTHSWSTQDAPGRVIATFPIHPDATNDYVGHVYQMYTVWLGGFKVRMRVIGTAFYGGGLFLVRIPPTFSKAQIEAMKLSTITAFPHTDIDPKNLSSIDMDFADFRQNHFHTGPLDLSDPNSFAGWFAIVVNARLVTQSESIHAVDLRVDIAGNFTFKVPGPIRTLPTEATGPLSPLSLNVRTLRGCDDTYSTYGATGLLVMPTGNRRVNVGNVFHRASGGEFYFRVGVNSQYVDPLGPAVPKWQQIIDFARNARRTGGDFEEGPPFLNAASPPSRFGYRYFNEYKAINSDQVNTWVPVNFRVGANTGVFTIAIDPTATDPQHQPSRIAGADLLTSAAGWQVYVIETEQIPFVAPLMIGTNIGGQAPPAETLDFPTLIVQNFDDPAVVAGESLVYVVTNSGQSVNSQALEWSQDLANFTEWPSGNAAMYVVKNAANQITGRIKMRQSGLCYTVGSAVPYYLQDGRLEFEQWAPENEPFTPMPTSQSQRLLTATIDRAAKKYVKALQRTAAL